MQNDGGGGNLGYMSQGRQDQEEKREEINIFAQKPDFDTFVLKDNLDAQVDVDFTLIGFITEVFHSIKSLLK